MKHNKAIRNYSVEELRIRIETLTKEKEDWENNLIRAISIDHKPFIKQCQSYVSRRKSQIAEAKAFYKLLT